MNRVSGNWVSENQIYGNRVSGNPIGGNLTGRNRVSGGDPIPLKVKHIKIAMLLQKIFQLCGLGIIAT